MALVQEDLKKLIKDAQKKSSKSKSIDDANEKFADELSKAIHSYVSKATVIVATEKGPLTGKLE